MRFFPLAGLCAAAMLLTASVALAAETWPRLPEGDGSVFVPAQAWPQRPGPREVEVFIHYPKGRLDAVGPRTGLMLTLHNWGGEKCAGTANPVELANRFDVVAICVNYLQSGKHDSIDAPEPYDFGYLQALDALRALWWVYDGLDQANRPFARGRIFATGGSGGGNVALMANKLAPRTFACIVDICGMPKLSDDIAFDLPGGSDLNARLSRDANSPNYLAADEQELRFVACPEHLSAMREWNSQCKVVVVHGADDHTCPIEDAREMVALMQASQIDVDPHFITQGDLDGKVFTGSGHSLGNRTQIVSRVADRYLLPDGACPLVRRNKPDFECRDETVRYRTTNGTFVISYAQGFPIGRFERGVSPVAYPEHQDLGYFLDDAGSKHTVASAADWEHRRQQVLANLQQLTGKLPGPDQRVPLAIEQLEETRFDGIVRRKITFQADGDDRVTAWLMVPDTMANNAPAKKLPAVLCLHQTTHLGKDEPAGLGGSEDLHYALELSQRGYVTLSPDYPSMGEHAYDFAAHPEYHSGSMKAVWDNIRGIDLLASLEEVDPGRIGCIGHSLGGHSAMFTATFDSRIKVIVSSCGFTRFHKDDVPSWTGPRYMPLIASQYRNDPDMVPFDFTEIVAGFAPRAFLACAAQRDADFDVSGVRDVIDAARPIYALHGRGASLQAYYPDGGHGFPADARRVAYEFIDRHLRHVPRQR